MPAQASLQNCGAAAVVRPATAADVEPVSAVLERLELAGVGQVGAERWLNQARPAVLSVRLPALQLPSDLLLRPCTVLTPL